MTTAANTQRTLTDLLCEHSRCLQAVRSSRLARMLRFHRVAVGAVVVAIVAWAIPIYLMVGHISIEPDEPQVRPMPAHLSVVLAGMLWMTWFGALLTGAMATAIAISDVGAFYRAALDPRRRTPTATMSFSLLLLEMVWAGAGLVFIQIVVDGFAMA